MSLSTVCNANVVQLNANNFDEYTSELFIHYIILLLFEFNFYISNTAKYELVFLNFYADWCRFSQILAPIFEESYKKVLEEFPVIRNSFFLCLLYFKQVFI